MSESLKSIKEIADLIGVSKSTVYRYIKSESIHESQRVGSKLLYDESSQKAINEAFGVITESKIIENESPDLISNELIDVLKNHITMQIEQLNIKDTQIAELQKSNDQVQQLLLYEQQKNTKLLEENINKKKWWHWWK